MAEFEQYTLMSNMKIGESLLWDLGMSRRWSPRANAWVVNGTPLSATDFARRRLKVDTDKEANPITEYWLQKAIDGLDDVVPERRLWLGDPGPATRTQTPVGPPPPEQSVGLNERLARQQAAREMVRGRQGRVTEWPDMPLPQNSPVPEWEDCDPLCRIVREYWHNGYLTAHPDDTSSSPFFSNRSIIETAEPEEGSSNSDSSDSDIDEGPPPRPAVPPTSGRFQPHNVPDLILAGRSYNWINLQRLIQDWRRYDRVFGGVGANWEQLPRPQRLRIVSLGRYKLYYEPKDFPFDAAAMAPIWRFRASSDRLMRHNRYIDGVMPHQDGFEGDQGLYDFGQANMFGGPGIDEIRNGRHCGEDISDEMMADFLDQEIQIYVAQGYQA